MNPTFAIIIPAYNEAATLPRLLESVARQTVPPDKVIVVDNNSNDGTREVAEKWGARVVFCSRQGIAAARNLGAQSVTATHVGFIDADACIVPDWMASARRAIMERRLDAVSGWNLFRERNPLLCFYYNSYHFYFYLYFLVANVLRGGMVSGNNMVIRRDLFLEVGGFPNLVGEDVRLGSLLAARKARTGICRGMHATFSARRFQREGFLKTVALWVRSVGAEIPEKDYRIRYTGKPGKS